MCTPPKAIFGGLVDNAYLRFARNCESNHHHKLPVVLQKFAGAVERIDAPKAFIFAANFIFDLFFGQNSVFWEGAAKA